MCRLTGWRISIGTENGFAAEPLFSNGKYNNIYIH